MFDSMVKERGQKRGLSPIVPALTSISDTISAIVELCATQTA